MSQPKRALIIVDVQEEYFAGPLAVQYPDPAQTEQNIKTIIAKAADAGIPVALIEHELPAGAPVFAADSPAQKTRPGVLDLQTPNWFVSKKPVSSALADQQLLQWLADQEINTLTLVGYMTNNCILATAAAAEPLGFAVEVLSDATAAIHLSNAAGTVSAQQLHETLLVLLHANWAATGSTATWLDAVAAQQELPKDNLVASAVAGLAATTATK